MSAVRSELSLDQLRLIEILMEAHQVRRALTRHERQVSERTDVTPEEYEVLGELFTKHRLCCRAVVIAKEHMGKCDIEEAERIVSNRLRL